MTRLSQGSALARFNTLSEDEARLALLACCASPRWADLVAGGRPYRDPDELYVAAGRALEDLSEADLAEALAGHPRIGQPREDDPVSAGEQAGVRSAEATLKAAIAEGNRRYEERFGHVYLVAATGRDADELLVDLRRRLDNDPETERAVLRDQLAKINHIRLAKLVGGTMSAVTTHVLDSTLGRPASGVPVRLELLTGDGPETLAKSETDADGRATDLGPDQAPAGVYRLVFDTAAYFAATGTVGFYPEVAVTFSLREPAAHCHVPVLLSPYAYSTYRGS